MYYTGLFPFIYVDVMLLTFFKTSLLIRNCTWQKKATLPLALSVGTTTNLLCSNFNSSIVILPFSFNVYLHFSCYLGWKMAIYSINYHYIKYARIRFFTYPYSPVYGQNRRLRGNKGQWKPVFWHILCSLLISDLIPTHKMMMWYHHVYHIKIACMTLFQ